MPKYRVTVVYNKTGKTCSHVFSGSSPDCVIGPAKGHFDQLFGEMNYKWERIALCSEEDEFISLDDGDELNSIDKE